MTPDNTLLRVFFTVHYWKTIQTGKRIPLGLCRGYQWHLFKEPAKNAVASLIIVIIIIDIIIIITIKIIIIIINIITVLSQKKLYYTVFIITVNRQLVNLIIKEKDFQKRQFFLKWSTDLSILILRDRRFQSLRSYVFLRQMDEISWKQNGDWWAIFHLRTAENLFCGWTNFTKSLGIQKGIERSVKRNQECKAM